MVSPDNEAEVSAVVPKKDSKKPLFEYKTVTEDGASVVLRFKPYSDAPGRIPRRHMRDIEAQLWAYMEWGLVEPANWPEDSELPGHGVFDVIPQRDITKCYGEWQGFELDEDDDS